MATFEPERCYICKKLFCCVDCCVNHIKNKHPGPISQCPLCRYEPLIVRNFEHDQLLCHLVFNHLPLRCRICGELFNNVEDLKKIGKCTQYPIIKIELPTFIDSIKSTSTINTPLSFDHTCYKSSLTKETGVSIDCDYNCDFSKFTSPPELTRNTSTPMHIGIIKSKNDKLQNNIIPKIPNIIFTTPSFSTDNDTEKSNMSVALSNSNSNKTESIYYSLRSSIKSDFSNTPSRSMFPMKSSSSDIEIQQLPFKNICNKKLASMEELEENENDMELTDIHGAIFTDNSTPCATKNISIQTQIINSEKNVRFDDQFKDTSEFNNAFDASEIEEFFEARQNLTEMSVGAVKDADIQNSPIKIIGEKNCLEKQTINKNNTKTENHCSKSESASRIVMMLLMEQTNDSRLSDFAPLVESSLKKLGSILSKSSSIERNTNSQYKDNTKSIEKISIVSVDTYTSVSTVECLKEPHIQSSLQQNRSETSNIGIIGTGIFSVVANAIKSAFRNLSGVTSTNLLSDKSTSSEEISKNKVNSTSRPGKRSRDDFDLISSDTPELSNKHENRYQDQSDVQSPLQKRLCGSYRHIRGREPIARMKNLISSPRGISSERQCFQQGSLTAGNTVIPLPSRAHQFTQTE